MEKINYKYYNRHYKVYVPIVNNSAVVKAVKSNRICDYTAHTHRRTMVVGCSSRNALKPGCRTVTTRDQGRASPTKHTTFHGQ